MTLIEAIELVIFAADEWAGEYGFCDPETARKVYEATDMLEKEKAMLNRTN